jgi:small subunit ribosomal protein S15
MMSCFLLNRCHSLRVASTGRLTSLLGASLLQRSHLALFEPHGGFTPVVSPQPQQQQQYRGKWTKTKKKRNARFIYRKNLAASGIALPKPPNFCPKDTTVVINASAQPKLLDEIQEQDAVAMTELQKKLAITNQTPVLRYHMTGLRMSDRVRKLFELHNGNQQEVVMAQKQRGMEVFQKREGDTGSPAVQVIALTTRIQQMQTHMATHKKDQHNKRGMESLYVRRRKMLDYMERDDFETYRRVVKTLGLIRKN